MNIGLSKTKVRRLNLAVLHWIITSVKDFNAILTGLLLRMLERNWWSFIAKWIFDRCIIWPNFSFSSCIWVWNIKNSFLFLDSGCSLSIRAKDRNILTCDIKPKVCTRLTSINGWKWNGSDTGKSSQRYKLYFICISCQDQEI